MGEYKSQIDSILNNQNYLFSEVNKVYPSFSLSNLVSQAQNQERDKIKNITNSKDDKNLAVTLNLANIYKEKYDILNANDKLITTNQDTYLTDFNENIEKIDQLNNVISTKNKIIQINQYEQSKKDRIIFIMQKIILFLVLMIIPVILMTMDYISIIIGIIFIIVCAIITVVVVFFQLKKMQDDELINLVNKTKNTAKDFAKTFVKNIVPKDFIKSCPSKQNPQVTVSYDNNSGNEVWLDNSENQWKDGDIPSIGATKQGYLALGEKVKPSPYYGGDPSTPEYTCKWTGDPSKRTNMNSKDTTFKTNIPCEYYPGYQTIRRDFPL